MPQVWGTSEVIPETRSIVCTRVLSKLCRQLYSHYAAF